MADFSPELQKLLELLEKKAKMTAMLAPSFLVDFSYPEIIGQLRRLGFKYVVEVARGARETNRELLELMKANPQQRYITAPCPTIVRLIRHKYPHLKQYLAAVGSPMAQTAKIVLAEYPDTKPVFIGPCPAKKIEAQEDCPDLGILVLTYQELKKVFELKGLEDDSRDTQAVFDMAEQGTRLYPLSGGLAQSCGFNKLLIDEEYDVVSGLEKAEEFLNNFPERKNLRVLDILFCDGGCIGGPGMTSSLSVEERRNKIIKHWQSDEKEKNPS